MNNRWLVFVVLSALLVAGLALQWVDAKYDVYYYPLRVLIGLGPELAGAAVTYGLFDWFIERPRRLEAEREAERQRIEDEKSELILEMVTGGKDRAIAALNKLRRRHWLYDGSLRGRDLGGVQLQGADLADANLQKAQLWKANLQGANLALANLQEARLHRANLQEARLADANLQEAALWSAKLQGANLAGASLREAQLWGAELDENATLPDGTKWTPDTDVVESMARFTDPDRPDFWQPPD
jgi:hypothetical protein